MNDDAITRAARALREVADGSSREAGATRVHLVAAAKNRQRRRFTALTTLLPMAAVLVLSTAWAAATGRLTRLFGTGIATASAPAPRPAIEPTPTPAIEPGPEPTPAIEPTPTRRGAQAASGVDVYAEEQLYAVAHSAHFVQRDAAAALRGWDSYLAAYPHGRFAPEARYNRALMLIRLGRTREARDALTPFAAGQLGGYRQREARELLDALDSGVRY
jgi:hypothetical protein